MMYKLVKETYSLWYVAERFADEGILGTFREGYVAEAFAEEWEKTHNTECVILQVNANAFVIGERV